LKVVKRKHFQVEKTMTIVTDIISGVHDSELDSIREAVNQRYKLKQNETAAKNLIEISVGDKIVFKDISPKYLNGSIATVTGKRSKKLEVKLDRPVGRYGESTVVVPASCVEKVA
jgi:hypothetical protein